MMATMFFEWNKNNEIFEKLSPQVRREKKQKYKKLEKACPLAEEELCNDYNYTRWTRGPLFPSGGACMRFEIIQSYSRH